MFDQLADRVTEIVEAFGYAGVLVLVAVENLFPPIPSEAVLPLAGFVAGRGEASYLGMVLAATVGSVLGAWALYWIAAAIGHDRLHRFVRGAGRWFGVHERDLVRAEAWFDRRSDAAVLIGRCIPLVRSVVSIPAGFRRMPGVRFTVLTAIGSTIWNAALIGAGAILGERWERVGSVIGLLQGLVIVTLVALVTWFAWRRLIRPRLARAGDLPITDG